MDRVCFAIVHPPIQGVDCFEPELLLLGATNVQFCLKADICLSCNSFLRGERPLDAALIDHCPGVSENYFFSNSENV
jgi:hypothetical protein